jgi:hypothetical protein
MDGPRTTALSAISALRVGIADEILTLQDSPNSARHSSKIDKLKQLGKKLQDVEAEIHDLASRAHKRVNELFT